MSRKEHKYNEGNLKEKKIMKVLLKYDYRSKVKATVKVIIGHHLNHEPYEKVTVK